MKKCPSCGDEKEFYTGKVFGITITNSDGEEMTVSIQIEICSLCGFKKCSILNK